MLNNKMTQNEVEIKFYSHQRLLSKNFNEDFKYITSELSGGNVCFQS